MNKRESSIVARIVRRLESARASVYLEFALIAPLAFAVVLFAADFCRILVAEQQLEIGSRILADVESHYVQNSETDGTPNAKTKMAVATHLKLALNLPSEDRVMSQVDVRLVPSIFKPIQKVVEWFKVSEGDSWIMKFVKTLFKTILNVLMGGLDAYIDQLFLCDKMVGGTCAVQLDTFFPKSAYAFFGNYQHTGGQGQKYAKGSFYVANTEYVSKDGKIDYAKRQKHYCWMPLMDTNAFAPVTWIRKAETNLRNSWFMQIIRKAGLNFKDYTKEVE